MKTTVIKMTDADFRAMERQAQKSGESLQQKAGAWIRHRLPQQLGEGGDLAFPLRNGLTVYIRKGKLHQPIQHFRQHGSRFPLVAKFYLSGSCRVQTLEASDIDSDYRETAGSHYLYHLPNQSEIEEWPVNQWIHGVMITAETDYFQSFNQQFEALPQPLNRLLQGDNKIRFHQPLGKITPQMRQLIQNILYCPYRDLMQQ
ncbi:MAG: AraC family transcriptional regulator, partial [Cyanobacteria bacterium J06635_11]